MVINPPAQQYIAELQRDTNVLGIILFGSWARGNNRPDSDIDLVVIVQNGYKRAVEHRDGQAFEFIFVTEQGALDFWEANPDDAVELWRVAQVLFDRNGAIARLRQAVQIIVQRGKPALTEDQYNHSRFDCLDQIKAVEGVMPTDPATASLLLAAKMIQLTELFFTIRQRWIPPPKQRLASIRELDHECHNLLARYYATCSLAAQINLAQALIARVFNRGIP
jgi:Nucleotidyltransferase domain